MTRWSSAAIGEQHDVSRFACGHESIDRWLREQALRSHQAGISHTTVWVGDDASVVAYHAASPTQFGRVELPSRSLSAGFTTIPGYLIGRLALDATLDGHGLGTQLLLVRSSASSTPPATQAAG